MPSPLILKLRHGAPLNSEDESRLEALAGQVRQVKGEQDLIHEGQQPSEIHLLMSGLACRYKQLPDGRVQIVALLVPGDFCDIHVALLDEMDHSIRALTNSSIVRVPSRAILDLAGSEPRITQALWWATLVDESVMREWLASAGARSAEERMAHLFCELQVRLEVVGLADETGYDLPITQGTLSEILGISPVHVNRTLQKLRGDDLLRFEAGRLTILDSDRLRELAGFDPAYLHLNTRSAPPDIARVSGTS